MKAREEIFNVGVSPSSITITPNGHYAYVTNANNYAIEGSDSVTVLDLKTGLPLTTIFDKSFNEPYRSAISPDGRYVYVANSGSPSTAQTPTDGAITIIDTTTNKVIRIIIGFDGPSGIVINNKGTVAYVNNYGAPGGLHSGNGKTISVVDLQNNIIINTITVDLAPAALALSDDNRYLYVANYVDGMPGTGTLTIIDTNNNNIVGTVPGLSGPFGIVLSKPTNKCDNYRNRYAYVTNFGSNNFAPYGTSVSVIDLKRKTIIKTINTGIQPAAIAITPNGRYVFVSNYNALYAGPNFQNLTYGESTLSIIRTWDNELVSPTIKIGETASYLAFSPHGSLYATNYVMNVVRALTFFKD